MLGGLEVVEVMRLRAAGLSVREIARRTGFSRNTVRKYLRAPEVPTYGPRAARSSKLDAFKPYLERRTAEGVWNAERLVRELKAMGFEGGVTILKEYLHPLRPAGVAKVAVRYGVAPGEEAQVDFGVFPFVDDSGRKRNVLAFVMVLSFSRVMSVAFVPQQDLSTLLRCHLQAFEELGGVPRRILYDNMKAVVAGRDGERVTFQSVLLDFALLAGFEPRACRPCRAQSKGRVERAIGYLRTSFWPAVRFTTLVDLNRQVEAWEISQRSPVSTSRPWGLCPAPPPHGTEGTGPTVADPSPPRRARRGCERTEWCQRVELGTRPVGAEYAPA